MQMCKRWLRQWRDYTGSNQLTLMGELTLCNCENTQLLELTPAERSLLAECEQALKERFPYLELECQERMVETSLKFFAYKHFIAEPQFLEALRSALAVTLHRLNSSDRLRARFIASGTIIDNKLEQKFSYLSKADVVEYKITASKPAGAIGVIKKQRLKAYVMLLAVAAVVIYFVYINLPAQQLHLLPTIDV